MPPLKATYQDSHDDSYDVDAIIWCSENLLETNIRTFANYKHLIITGLFSNFAVFFKDFILFLLSVSHFLSNTDKGTIMVLNET